MVINQPTSATETTIQPVTSDEETVSVSLLVIGLLAGMGGFSLGTFTGIIGLLTFINRLMKNVQLLDLIERLMLSIHPDTLSTIRKSGFILQDTGKIIEAVTDGKPNEPIDPSSDMPTLEEADAILYGDPPIPTDT